MSQKKIVKNAEEKMPMIIVEGPSRESLNEIPFVDEDPTGKNVRNEEKRRESFENVQNHRKNSISLPNLDDLLILKDLDQQISSPSEEDELESDDELSDTRAPSRNVRRKSVLSPRMLTPPELGDFADNSGANSITSVNSLASLLKEKIQNLPQTIRKKKSNDYKIKIFVVLLFITIVVLVCCAYFLYNQKILAKAYFEKIKFNKIKRIMKIYNNDGIEIIEGRLGITLNYDNVLPCLPRDEKHDGSICLEWMDRARLYLDHFSLQEDLKCYNIRWISLNPNLSPTDCITMTSGVHWYGGGQNRESAWPLEKGGHEFHPFVTGNVERHEWGNVLKRYFINSKGAALIVDEKTPLYIAIKNNTKNKEFCIKAQYDNFAYANKLTAYSSSPMLNYSICTGQNMTYLQSQLSDHPLWDGLNNEDIKNIESLLTEPLWEISTDFKESLTEEIITNFTYDIIQLGTFKLGHVLLNEFWQNHVGDFEVDTERFPTLDKAIDMLTRRGFRVVFTIQPFISTESLNFADAVEKRLLVLERFSGRAVPALTSFKTMQSAGVLDITNNRTIPWLVDKLKGVINKYKFNAFYVELGTAYDMPHYYQCEKPLINPDQYKTIFINSLRKSVDILGVSDAIQRPKPPTFVSLPKFESSWDGLRRVIPTILTYGIIGYPFVISGAVGGDFDAVDSQIISSHYSLINGTMSELEDQELYIRWLQVAAFLPVIRYNRLPNSYRDKKVSDLALSLAVLRQNKVTPALKSYYKESLNYGIPIIRPLWMLDPQDPSCQIVLDQFSIGDGIIVAPILHSGAREREVYLPAGVWKDGIHKRIRKGSQWIHDYKVELDEVAYFERMPDDTRF